MLLIAEIILTIFAWRKGWKWLALLPLAIAFTIGMIIGFTSGIDGNLGVAAALDIAAIIALIVMIAKPKKIKES